MILQLKNKQHKINKQDNQQNQIMPNCTT